MQKLIYLLVLAGMLAGYYDLLGPGPGPSEIPEDLEWWRSSGLAHTSEAFAGLEELAEGGFPGAFVTLGLFWLPAVLMLVWGLRLFASAVMRTLCTTGFFLLMIFPYYGYMADRVWRFFEWRSPAVAATFAGITAVGLFAPSLLRALLNLSRAATVVALMAVLGAVFMLTTEVTGTNQDMRFNISPWPVVTLFGALLIGSAIASFHIAAGAGSWLAGRLGGTRGLAAGALGAGVLGALLTRATLRAPEIGALVLAAGICAVYALARSRFGPADVEQARRMSLVAVAAGVFSFFAIHASNRAATAFQKTARNETATRLLVALEEHREQHGSFPRRLYNLVPDFFEEVPRPRIGLILNEDDEFMYRNLGDSYLLEFSSVQWVQCAYSPPFDVAKYSDEDIDEDEEDEEEFEEPPVDLELQALLDDHGLDGAWSCEDAPPKLW